MVTSTVNAAYRPRTSAWPTPPIGSPDDRMTPVCFPLGAASTQPPIQASPVPPDAFHRACHRRSGNRSAGPRPWRNQETSAWIACAASWENKKRRRVTSFHSSVGIRVRPSCAWSSFRSPPQRRIRDRRCARSTPPLPLMLERSMCQCFPGTSFLANRHGSWGTSFSRIRRRTTAGLCRSREQPRRLQRCLANTSLDTLMHGGATAWVGGMGDEDGVACRDGRIPAGYHAARGVSDHLKRR